MSLVTQAHLQMVLIENMACSWVKRLMPVEEVRWKCPSALCVAFMCFCRCGSFLPAFCCWMCTFDEHWQGRYSKPSPSTTTNRSCHPQPILPTKMSWRSNQESIQNKHGMPQYEQQQQQQQQWHNPHQQRIPNNGQVIILSDTTGCIVYEKRTTTMTPWRTASKHHHVHYHHWHHPCSGMSFFLSGQL